MSDSIFIQLGSIQATELADALEYAYRNDLYTDVCVSQVADTDGNLYVDKLEILEPYLPWGDKPTFNNVFFGTNVDYTGWSRPYADDMANGVFRWKLLHLQKLIAARISGRYLGRVYHWYIEHEAPLNHLSEPSIRAGYEAFLVQSIRDLNALNPRGAILWSPAFWTPSIPAGLDLAGFFERVAHYAGRPIDWLHLQDMLGRDRPDIDIDDAIAWLRALPSFSSKRVNMELFRTIPEGMTAEDREVIEARRRQYQAAGIGIGISWELRYDFRARTALAPPVVPTPAPEDTLVSITQSYTGAHWPRLRAYNTWQSNRDEVSTWLRTGAVNGKYARRAIVAADLGRRLHKITGLEVQGIRYMRPYSANPSTGRAINSDHLTAGAIDIFIRTEAERAWLPYLYETFRILEERGVVRYIVKLGYNAAHWNHIHVSLQVGVQP